jgi:hypothetical protein
MVLAKRITKTKNQKASLRGVIPFIFVVLAAFRAKSGGAASQLKPALLLHDQAIPERFR